MLMKTRKKKYSLKAELKSLEKPASPEALMLVEKLKAEVISKFSNLQIYKL